MTKAAPGTMCSEKVWDGFMRRYHPCGNRATVVRGTKPLCSTHDPRRIAARQATARIKGDAVSAYRDAKYGVQAQEAVVLAAARHIYQTTTDQTPDLGDFMDLLNAVHRLTELEADRDAKRDAAVKLGARL